MRNCFVRGEFQGGRLNQEVINVFRKHHNLTIRDGYGQTESTLLIGNLVGSEIRLGAMGKSMAEGLALVGDRRLVPYD